MKLCTITMLHYIKVPYITRAMLSADLSLHSNRHITGGLGARLAKFAPVSNLRSVSPL